MTGAPSSGARGVAHRLRTPRDDDHKWDPATHRRTKIVATIGPATRSVEAMCELIEAGADLFRLNFSHGTPAQHAENVAMARQAAGVTGKEVGILGDLPGPRLRLSELQGGVIHLQPGSDLALTTERVVGTRRRITVSHPELPTAVRPGDEVYLADGRIRLRVADVDRSEVLCRVEVGGPVASHQGMNLPGSSATFSSTGGEDLEWVDFALAHALDLLAVSFVRRAADLAPVELRVRAAGGAIPVIAKIEKPEAAENAEEIVRAASAGVMVARGDLGIELPLEEVPAVQRQILALAGRLSKPSITATQMLASMVDSPRPTRAEVSDVATAIQQGTDAVMLSEETAIGKHAAEAVRVMDRVARQVEPDLPYADWLLTRTATESPDVAGSVARAAVGSTYSLGLAALVVPSRSGRTAQLVSAHRPRVPVLAVSPRIETVRKLNLLFGISCRLAEDPPGLGEVLGLCARLASQTGIARTGELIGITAGMAEQGLGTNLFEVHRVP